MVGPKYDAMNKQSLDLSKTTTRLMEKLMITHGNEDCIAQIIYELRRQQYKNSEEKYYNQTLYTLIHMHRKKSKFWRNSRSTRLDPRLDE